MAQDRASSAAQSDGDQAYGDGSAAFICVNHGADVGSRCCLPFALDPGGFELGK